MMRVPAASVHARTASVRSTRACDAPPCRPCAWVSRGPVPDRGGSGAEPGVRATAAVSLGRSGSPEDVPQPPQPRAPIDPVTAREVDALVEGLVLHSALSTDPMDATQIRSALHRLAG